MKKLFYGLLIVSAIQNVSLKGANLTSDEKLAILEDLLSNNRLHELNDLYTLIYNLPEDQKRTFCSKALNHYFDAHRLHGLNNLSALIYNLPEDQKRTFYSKALNHYFDAHRLHELNSLSALIYNLPEDQKGTFRSKALNHYIDTSTLFKHDTIIKDCTTIPKHTFLISPEKFIQKIDTLNIDEKYQKQLYMYYIRKKIENNNLPYASSDFPKQLLKSLSLENIVAIIEHIHESTDICGQSMEKVRPLCQAYLMHCEDLPNSMPIEYFTDLFSSFRTKTPLLAKITDSMVTFKSIIPQSLMKISKFKGDPLTFKPDAPEKIQELYRQYKHTGIVGDTLVISRDEQPSVE